MRKEAEGIEGRRAEAALPGNTSSLGAEKVGETRGRGRGTRVRDSERMNPGKMPPSTKGDHSPPTPFLD